jgi:hypothetical protein
MAEDDPSGGQSLYHDVAELHRLRIEVAELRQRLGRLHDLLLGVPAASAKGSAPAIEGLPNWCRFIGGSNPATAGGATGPERTMSFRSWVAAEPADWLRMRRSVEADTSESEVL